MNPCGEGGGVDVLVAGPLGGAVSSLRADNSEAHAVMPVDESIPRGQLLSSRVLDYLRDRKPLQRTKELNELVLALVVARDLLGDHPNQARKMNHPVAGGLRVFVERKRPILGQDGVDAACGFVVWEFAVKLQVVIQDVEHHPLDGPWVPTVVKAVDGEVQRVLLESRWARGKQETHDV